MYIYISKIKLIIIKRDKCHFFVNSLLHLISNHQIVYRFVGMKKLVVLFFLLIYLFSSTEFSELLKIDRLFEHFKEHKKATSQISFSTFFYMHYLDHGKENGDSDKDAELPFHSHSESAVINFVLPVILPINHYNVSFILIRESRNKINYYDHQILLTSSYLASIWQPPQII